MLSCAQRSNKLAQIALASDRKRNVTDTAGAHARIPKAVADAVNVSNGKRAEIIVENGAMVLRPILKSRRKPRYTLDQLLRGMTKDDVPQQVEGARRAAMRHGEVRLLPRNRRHDLARFPAIEQAGQRPALVFSPRAFNQLTGRCITCPITRRDHEWSFHVPIPEGDVISGSPSRSIA